MSYVNGIHKSGMHEASRIAQALLHREAELAAIAAAGERVDRAKADRLPPPTAGDRVRDRPDQRRGREHDGGGADDADGDEPDDRPGGRIDVTA